MRLGVGEAFVEAARGLDAERVLWAHHVKGARIFLLKPKILLADEPTSMVDACSRATILDMLLQLRDEIGMTVIFITHDIGLAYYISDTVYIMEHGRFVEFGKADEVILNPKAAYTKRLISDVPKIHEEWDLSTVELK